MTTADRDDADRDDADRDDADRDTGERDTDDRDTDDRHPDDAHPFLVRAAGVLLLRGDRRPDGTFAVGGQPREFLLLQRPKWWDLPKGHVDPGETEPLAAMRELTEETGLTRGEIAWVDGFSWCSRYPVSKQRYHKDNGPAERPKRVRFFLAWCRVDKPIELTEHIGSEWVRWAPPHQIQPFTVDPLLAAAAAWLEQRPSDP